jgi:hypothetical protein
MFNYTLGHICSYTATLRQPLEVIGETPVGLRLNAYISGGDPPAGAAIQASPRYLTSHSDYPWLNRLQALLVGMADVPTGSVSYDAYAVRSRVLE